MNREEALKQIEVINEAIEASQKFLLSGVLAIAYGLIILTIPFIEIATQKMTFGRPLSNILVASLHVIIYSTLFFATRIIVEKIWAQDKSNPPHPLLIEALSFHKPVVASICGAILVLTSAGQLDLAGPIVFMMLGILINIYGRFSSSFIMALSWSYIILGIAFGLLTSKEQPYLWVYFNSYLGLSFIAIGIHSLREKARELASH